MRINVNNVSYHLTQPQENDERPYLILLHGFMGSGQAFKHIIPGLAKFCNPITVDLLGHGKTGGAFTANRFSLAHQLSDLRAILETLNLPAFFLYGYSMGGRLALRYALEHQDHLSGLILESTSIGLSDDERPLRINQDEARAQRILDDFDGFLDDWARLSLFQSPKKSSNAAYDKMQRGQHPQQMAFTLQGFGSGTMSSVEKQLEKFPIPALLIAGGNDAKYCAQTKRMHALMPSSQRCIVPSAGHRVHLDCPEMLLNELEKFIPLH